VHTPVKANGKNSNTTEDSPLWELSVTSDSPSGVFVLRVKFGADVPTDNVIKFNFNLKGL
jgi:hypothetical protein